MRDFRNATCYRLTPYPQTSRISSRGKGPVYNTGGGGGGSRSSPFRLIVRSTCNTKPQPHKKQQCEATSLIIDSYPTINTTSSVISYPSTGLDRLASSDSYCLLSSQQQQQQQQVVTAKLRASLTPAVAVSKCCRRAGKGFLTSPSKGQAACMIIEDRPPLSIRPRQNNVRQQDSAQRFLNHLVLLKHRTAKFSSNRHRKLQPFRET